MKIHPVLILIAMLGFAQSAFCQAVRWRFTIPATTYQKDLSLAQLAANDGLGGAVFIVSDYRYYPPEAGVNGWESVGTRLFWLDYKGKLLHTLTVEGEPVYPPGPVLLTPTVLHIALKNDAGVVTGIRRVARTLRGIKVSNFNPPAGESVAGGTTPPGTTDAFGHLTFKHDGDSVTQVVRYDP